MRRPTIRAWRSMMPHVVTVEEPLAKDQYGKVTSWGAPAEYRARVQGKNRLVRDMDGKEVVSSVTAYIATTDLISSQARITLPEEFVPRTPPIKAIALVSDEGGPHHVVVYLA